MYGTLASFLKKYLFEKNLVSAFPHKLFDFVFPSHFSTEYNLQTALT